MTVPIIDVSHYQKVISWDDVDRELVLIKATEWVDWQDPYFARNWSEARRCKKIRVPFHFWRNVSVTGQLTNLLTTLGTDKGDAKAVMIDVEIDPVDYDQLYQLSLSLSLSFSKILIYSSVRYWKDDNPRWKQFDLYVADWTPPVSIPRPWTNYVMWQQGVSGYGEVPGISTRCDYGVFNGTRESMLQWAGLTSWPPADEPQPDEPNHQALLEALAASRTRMEQGFNDVLQAIKALQPGDGGGSPDPGGKPADVRNVIVVPGEKANGHWQTGTNAKGKPMLGIKVRSDGRPEKQWLAGNIIPVRTPDADVDGTTKFYEVYGFTFTGNKFDNNKCYVKYGDVEFV